MIYRSVGLSYDMMYTCHLTITINYTQIPKALILAEISISSQCLLLFPLNEIHNTLL